MPYLIFHFKKELFKLRTSERKTKLTQRIIIETENAGDVSKKKIQPERRKESKCIKFFNN